MFKWLKDWLRRRRRARVERRLLTEMPAPLTGDRKLALYLQQVQIKQKVK